MSPPSAPNPFQPGDFFFFEWSKETDVGIVITSDPFHTTLLWIQPPSHCREQKYLTSILRRIIQDKKPFWFHDPGEVERHGE